MAFDITEELILPVEVDAVPGPVADMGCDLRPGFRSGENRLGIASLDPPDCAIVICLDRSLYLAGVRPESRFSSLTLLTVKGLGLAHQY